MADMSREQVKELVRQYFIKQWQKVNDDCWCIVRDTTIDRAEEAIETEKTALEIKDQLADGTYDIWVHDGVKSLVDQTGRQLHKLDETYAELCEGVARARVQSLLLMAARLKGEFDKLRPADPLFHDILDPGLPAIDDTEPAGVNRTQVCQLQFAIKQYLKKLRDNKIGEKNIADQERILGWAVELIGGPNRTLTSITKAEIRNVRDVLVRLPKSFSQLKQFNGMSLVELANVEGVNRVSPTTAFKNFSMIKAFFKWAEEEDLIGGASSPAASVKMALPAGAAEKRNPFSDEQLLQFFSSPLYTGCKSKSSRNVAGDLIICDSKYWIPLVAMLSGLRMGEILQLLVSDVKTANNMDGNGTLLYFDITKGEIAPGESKRLKTATSEREVPLHNLLLELGFLEFVAAKKAENPKGRLFADIQKGSNGYYSATYTKWFSRYLRTTGIKTTDTTFHSFRHWFIDAARSSNVGEREVKALVGHADDTVTSGYGAKLRAKSLDQYMQQVVINIDVNHLMPISSERRKSAR